MPFVLLDDKFHSNPKTLEVGNAGAGLFARALSYCGDHLTDGFVPLGWAREAAGRKALLDRLTAARLWIEVAPGDGPFTYKDGDLVYTVYIEKPGFFIEDYLTLNPTRQSVLHKRSELAEKRAEAGRKGAMRRWHPDSKEDGKPIANAWQTDSPTPSSPKNLGSFPLTEASHVRGSTYERIEELCVARSDDPEAAEKLDRTRKANNVSEAELETIWFAITRPDTLSPLAKALSMMDKEEAA